MRPVHPALAPLVRAAAEMPHADCALVLRQALADKAWLRPEHRVGDPPRYMRHVLYVDPGDRFVITAITWLAGQVSPMHGHHVWCAFGVAEGDLTEERFDAALNRLRERLRLRRLAAVASSEPVESRAFLSHLVSRVGSRDLIIPLEAIDYIEADDVYAAVITRGKRHLVRTALDALERALDPAIFVRIHRSYIVRIDRVAEIRRDKKSGPELVLDTGAAIPVSRRRRAIIDSLLKPLAT